MNLKSIGCFKLYILIEFIMLIPGYIHFCITVSPPHIHFLSNQTHSFRCVGKKCVFLYIFIISSYGITLKFTII